MGVEKLSNVTKEDIENLKADIKEHIDLRLEPIVTDVNGHKITLYGKDGRNGVVKDVNDMKGGFKMVKWVASSGLAVGLTKWWHSLS